MDKKIHTFLKGISPKVKVTVWLEFELTYSKVAVQHLSHDAKETTHEQEVTQGQFFSGVQLIWIQSFFSKADCLPRLKSSALLFTNDWRKEQIDLCLS